MKRNVYVLRFWLFICSNFWYLPLLLVLLYMKVSLISMFRNAILAQTAGRHDRGLGPNAGDYLTTHTRFKRNRGQGLGHEEEIEHEVKVIKKAIHGALTPEDIRILERLEDSRIQPSGENRTDPNSVWLILNQVPRGGGGLIREILQSLEADNGFKHIEHEYRTPWNRFLIEEEQKNLVTWFEYQHLPRSYERHFFFVNFTKYQKYITEQPIYINMVRDPAARIRSLFRHRRKDRQMAKQEIKRRDELEPGSGDKWYKLDFATCVLESEPECEFASGSNDFTLSVPFFCGQFNSCVEIDNKWAVQAAKFNVEKYYSVVGVYESLGDTVQVLEHYVPKFFAGATKLELPHLAEDPVSEDVRAVLEKKLPYEFELYAFICQRLENQLIAMYNRGMLNANQP